MVIVCSMYLWTEGAQLARCQESPGMSNPRLITNEGEKKKVKAGDGLWTIDGRHGQGPNTVASASRNLLSTLSLSRAI